MKRLALIILVVLVGMQPLYAQKREPGKVRTLVIDPGHGGDKPGAISGKIVEKDLVLDVARKFGSMVKENFPDVKIVYTRTGDEDVTLANRAMVANRAKADLFVSIHANSHPKDAPSGVETFVMGLSQSKANMEVAKKENADILLESGYKSNSDYQGFDPNSPESYVMFAMYQNAYLSKSLDFANFLQKQYSQNTKSINRGVKQAELFVIYKTAMPSVLTEIGFISNPSEEAFLCTEEGKKKIALCLYNAFALYKAREEGSQPKILQTSSPMTTITDSKVVDADIKTVKANTAKREEHHENTPVLPAPSVAADTIASKPAVALKIESKESENNQRGQTFVVSVDDSLSYVSPENVIEAAVEDIVVEPSEKVQKNEPSVPEPKLVVQAPVAPKSTDVSSHVVFRVQFLSGFNKLPKGDRQLKGLNNYDFYMQGRRYCYVWGKANSIESAKALLSEVKAKGFNDAFVVAFYNGEKISIAEAKELLRQ
ncbi:MAG: N-acetylmuramoyl-L-alanine amidase [Bacteroidales bacterium]|nr:N-acetylmuramoyl-L-alanine amidase [Candidatus Colimorpha onthohippi]